MVWHGLDISKEVLLVSVGQRAAELWAVKVGALTLSDPGGGVSFLPYPPVN